MTWTSDRTLTTNLQKVRNACGDTDPNDKLLQDEEINGYISACPGLNAAAVTCCVSIMGILARRVAQTIGRTSFANQQMFDMYEKLHAKLLAGGDGDLPGGDGTGLPNALPWAGGQSEDEREALWDDDDLIQPTFSLGMHDSPGGTGNPNTLPDWLRW